MSEPLVPTTRRLAFCLIASLLLAALADLLFFRISAIGANLGIFALAWSAAAMLVSPVLRWRRSAVAAVLATGFALLLIENPGPLAWALFWASIGSAAILTLRPFDDALRWSLRLSLYLGYGLIGPFAEQERLISLLSPRGNWRAVAPMVILPLVGGAIFLGLFAAANPIIGNSLAAIRLPNYLMLHILLWIVAFMAVWPSLRPHRRLTESAMGAASLGRVPSPPIAAVGVSLICFNLLFTLQNVLDILFLWSGAPLPAGVTLAEYAHRGAYLLIATAILAGLFVLIALRPGTDGARSPAIRRLVALWVAQNMLLVASSMLRTIDYVQAYSLTELRIWALGWMLLVGIGLALICWRLWFNRSGAWLINMNAAAAAAALTLAATCDTAGFAAEWNVRHAPEVGGSGAAIDLCYLRELGPAALLPLIELEGGGRDPILQDRARAVRDDVLSELEMTQRDWRGWTFRNARRLALAHAMLGPKPVHAAAMPNGRACDGTPILASPER